MLTMPVALIPFRRQFLHQFSFKSLYHHVHCRHESTVQLPLFASGFNPKFQDKFAFKDFQGKQLTYADLAGRSLHVASELKRASKEATRVSFLCPHDASFPITLWGTWLAGHAGVPLSESHPDNLLEFFLKASESNVMVTVPKYAERLNKVAKRVGCEFVVIDFDKIKPESMKDQHFLLDPARYIEKDALILFTSGTTGQPKGVLLTHENLEDQVKNICDSFDINDTDTLLHVLPLHHTHGVVHALLSPLAVGARCLMLEKFSAPEVWKEILSNKPARPTILMGVPTVYVKLIKEYGAKTSSQSRKDFIRGTCTNKMRLFLSGSASLPVPVLNKWESITGHRILERYGMTEVGVMLSNPLKGQRKPGFVGTPFPSVRVRIAELNSGSVNVLAEGDAKEIKIMTETDNSDAPIIGDLLTKGPSVFKGYYNNPEATAKEFTNDGWFITGDTVEYKKTEDSFKVLGRKSVDIIKSGGYKLSSLEIEAQLLALEEILEVSVLGLPDPKWGQRVAAAIVWRQQQLDLESLRKLAKTRLPSYMVPTVVKTMEKLPRNHLGKVNKKELAKEFE